MVQPACTTTYTLTATGRGGTASASTTVTVAPVVTSYTTSTASYAPATNGSQGNDLYGISAGTPWLMYLLLIALLAAVAAIIVLLVRRKPAAVQARSNAGYMVSSATTGNNSGLMTKPATTGYGAKFVSARGGQIDLGGRLGFLGRQDFQSFLPPDRADLVSRQHIIMGYDNGNYYIEDRQSTNGTRLNGVEIRGSGRHMLKDGDIIDLGNALTLTFKT